MYSCCTASTTAAACWPSRCGRTGCSRRDATATPSRRGSKLQATRYELRATSYTLRATSHEPRATRYKLHAASYTLHATRYNATRHTVQAAGDAKLWRVEGDEILPVANLSTGGALVSSFAWPAAGGLLWVGGTDGLARSQ